MNKRVIVTPDKHFPLHDQPAINVVKKAIEIVKPDAYIDLGDVGEFKAFSTHEDKRRKPPPFQYKQLEYDKDIKDVNAGMDQLDEALDKVNCKEKYITEGNHDNWLNMTVDSCEYPIEQYRFKNAVRLEERGYKYYPFGSKLKIGKLYFTHGYHYGTQYHANVALKGGGNYMYGHRHSIQTLTTFDDDFGPRSAWCIGCLKDMSPQANYWLNYKITNWQHAFAIVDFFGQGYFTVHLLQIINGRTSLWGELIDGNKK